MSATITDEVKKQSLGFLLAMFRWLIKMCRYGNPPIGRPTAAHLTPCFGNIPGKIHDWWPVERLKEGKKYATLASLQADQISLLKK